LSDPSSSSPRRPRSLLVALLVAAAVVAVGVGGLVAALTSGDPDSPATESDRPAAGTPATEAEARRIRLGDTDYIHPCRLLGVDDVTRTFGELGARGYVRQEFLDESMSDREFRRATRNVSDAVQSSCTYELDDRKDSTLRVVVDQFRTPDRAKAEWASIAYLGTGKESKKLARETYGDGFGWVVELARENEQQMGGAPVPGARRSLLYVSGQQSFVTYGGNVVVRLYYATADDAFLDEPLTPKEYRYQAPRMVQAAEVIRERLAEGGLEQAPLGPALHGETAYADGVPFLDACRLLDAEVFHALLGVPPDNGAESRTLVADPSQGGGNTCERRARKQGPKRVTGTAYNADLEVHYAAGLDEAPRLLETIVVARNVDGEGSVGMLVSGGYLELQKDTSADLFYILDSTVQTGRRDRYAHAYLSVGPYVLRLDASTQRNISDFSSPSARRYRAAVELLVEKVRALQADLEEAAE